MTKPGRVPITTYILKVASRCNLNCRYCYVYNKGDETFQDQPYRMDEHTVSALLERIATYSADEHVHEINFIFHGGEPLLAGRGFFRDFVARANGTLAQDFNVSYALETNATLLTAEWLDLFHELGIGFAISSMVLWPSMMPTESTTPEAVLYSGYGGPSPWCSRPAAR